MIVARGCLLMNMEGTSMREWLGITAAHPVLNAPSREQKGRGGNMVLLTQANTLISDIEW